MLDIAISLWYNIDKITVLVLYTALKKGVFYEIYKTRSFTLYKYGIKNQLY